jgi:hypothetical protein
MKRALLIICLLLPQILVTRAEEAMPLPNYFESAETVCLAKVTAVDGRKITFTVTQTLRGQPKHVMQVNRAGGAENYAHNSEWLLVSCSYGLENSVGWDEDRPASWIPGAVIRDGGHVYITDWTARLPGGTEQPFGIAWDTTPDGKRCLTLDHVERLLMEHPYRAKPN